MKIKNIKSIVSAWKNGIYTPEMALKLLLKELDMEDKRMTDNEIKKALECCLIADSKCADCHFSFERHFCKNALLRQTLDLINRLEAEIERLKEIEYMYNDLCK